jgi:HlyD family secretion protein
MKKWLRRAGPLLMALLILAGILYGFWPRPIEVDLAEVSRGPLTVTVDDEGKTRIRERYVITAPLAGAMRRVPLKPGHPVEAGKTVVALIEPVDPSLLNPREKATALEQVKVAEAAHEQAVSRIAAARREHLLALQQLARVKKNYESGAASIDDVHIIEAREQVRAEEVKAAEAGEKIAAFNLLVAKAALIESSPKSALPVENAKREIYSPITGRVLKVYQESATILTPGEPILILGDPSDLELEIEVLTTDAVKITPGNSVLIERWGGDYPLRGRVRLIEPMARTKISALGVEEQRVKVIADFTDPPEKWSRLGDEYRVEARIVVWEAANVIRVPTGALFRTPSGGWAVYRWQEGTAVLTPVQIGHTTGLEAEVLDGLQPGDRVVLHPSDRVKDGVPIVGR